MEQVEKYLRSTPTIDCGIKSIKEKAEDLTKGQEEVIDKAKSLFYFVRDEVKYNPYLFTKLLEEYRASATLNREKGFCIQKSVLLAALARSVGIPARLRFADIRNHILPEQLAKLNATDLITYHGYNELYIEGKWVKATIAFDLATCQKNRLIPVEFDGEHDAIFHSHNLDGKLHIEYVQDHGHYDDLPLDKLIAANIQVYGPNYFERFEHLSKTREAQG
jgi:transglutaminase-like putative cysteine protease